MIKTKPWWTQFKRPSHIWTKTENTRLPRWDTLSYERIASFHIRCEEGHLTQHHPFSWLNGDHFGLSFVSLDVNPKNQRHDVFLLLIWPCLPDCWSSEAEDLEAGMVFFFFAKPDFVPKNAFQIQEFDGKLARRLINVYTFIIFSMGYNPTFRIKKTKKHTHQGPVARSAFGSTDTHSSGRVHGATWVPKTNGRWWTISFVLEK